MEPSAPTDVKTAPPASAPSETKIVSGDELSRVAEDAFRQGADALDHAAEDAPSVNLFGVFDVDPGTAAYAKTAYNVLSDFLSKLFGDRANDIAKAVLRKTSLSAPAVQKIAAVTTLGADLILKGGGYVGQALEPYKKHRNERTKLSLQLAPVLDDMKGNHSAATFMSITADQNEVIYAHRRRMAKLDHAENFENLIDFAVNVTPNMALSIPQFWGMYSKGQSAAEAAQAAHEKIDALKGSGNQSTLGQLQMLGSTFVGASAAGFSNHLKKVNRRKLEKSMQPYSALEMVLTLEEQVAHDPKASSFQTPGKSGDSYPLEEYIMRVMIQHQKDMASIDPQATELRAALKEDMAALAKPIAESIREGDLSALTLVRWIGEGKLIKNHGRAVANPKEIEALLARSAKKPQPSPVVNPKEYYAEASFTREELKSVLHSLNGEEKLVFAAMFPDNILHEAGISDAEVKSIRGATLKSYEHTLSQAVAGLAAKGDAELKKEGLAKHEIKQLREAFEQIQGEGEHAIHKLKASPANTNGIERPLTNWAVNSVKGGKAHLGTVLHRGDQQLAAAAADAKAEASDKSKNEHDDDMEKSGHYAKREQRATGDEMAEQAR